jgi:hypothetical protein
MTEFGPEWETLAGYERGEARGKRKYEDPPDSPDELAANEYTESDEIEMRITDAAMGILTNASTVDVIESVIADLVHSAFMAGWHWSWQANWEDEEPPIEEHDPGPEIDDQGGMSDFYPTPNPEPPF